MTYRAPGRVNLIGDHTDYNEGFVLPLAIDLECVVRARPRDDGVVRLVSDAYAGVVELHAAGELDPRPEPRWGRLVSGVVRALASRGRPAVGMDAEVSSTVPTGSGLSSSAAFEVAVALALCDVASFELAPLELALACQEAEQAATGVPSGIMDQLASLSGREGHALLIDCRSLAVEPVPLPAGIAVVAVHSGVSRALADTAYAERRRECERVASALGLRSLRDATPEQVAHEPRARHVVSENARVLAAVDALRSADVGTLGRLLAESHASLRDGFEVSTPELDALVRALTAAGAHGARLTGAGFGGCVVATVDGAEAEAVVEEACAQYRAETGREPRAFVLRAVDGAGPGL